MNWQEFAQWFIPLLGILVALSGWATFLNERLTSKPKIKGQILNVMTGTMVKPNNSTKRWTVFMVYLYLLNTRKNQVHMLNYELEIDVGKGYEKVHRLYGLPNTQEWKFDNPTMIIEIPDFIEKLIYTLNKPVEYGIALKGWIPFASEKPQDKYEKNVKKIKITCIDVFQKKHTIETQTKEFPDFAELQEIAGIKIIKKQKPIGI